MTSRWVVEAAAGKGVPVRWRAYSLAIKNENTEVPEQYRPMLRTTLSALRVVEAAWAQYGDGPIGGLYTELGTRFHLQNDISSDAVAAALEATGLDPALMAASEDEKWDAEIRASMADAIEAVGDEVGVPILVFHDGDRVAGISGPIMSPAVTGEPALALWDNVVSVTWNPDVFELKRSRTTGPIL
jgi:2-hydroxychromene-2-carboxylate isomerase